MAVNQTRNVFFSRIGELMSLHEDIVIVSVDLAGPPFDVIREKFPKRYISVGIAEQNAVALACGLASEGLKPIVYAANPFLLLRALDQIRNGMCMMELPVALAGLGTGFSVAEMGSTHFMVEDIALASLCPNLDIVSVSDTQLSAAFAEMIPSLSKPTYCRFGKWAGEELTPGESVNFSKGWRKVRIGDRIAVVSTGCTVPLLRNALEGMDGVALYDWFCPSSSESISRELTLYQMVVSVEEQLLRGGIGSILLEAWNSMGISVPLRRMGLQPDSYPQIYGNRDYWLEQYGLSGSCVRVQLEEALGVL